MAVIFGRYIWQIYMADIYGRYIWQMYMNMRKNDRMFSVLLQAITYIFRFS